MLSLFSESDQLKLQQHYIRRGRSERAGDLKAGNITPLLD